MPQPLGDCMRDKGRMQFLKRKQISDEERITIISKIRKPLKEEKKIIFAYLYGSFVKEDEFNDIDIGIYLEKEKFLSDYAIFKYSLSLSSKIEMELPDFEIDMRVLNEAPLSFQYQVITEGRIVIEKDNDKRVDFESYVRDLYFDFIPHRDAHYKIVVLGE